MNKSTFQENTNEVLGKKLLKDNFKCQHRFTFGDKYVLLTFNFITIFLGRGITQINK